MGHKFNYIITSALYLGSVFSFVFFLELDIDFKITYDSFVNIIVIITIIYFLGMCIIGYLNYKEKKRISEQVSTIKDEGYLIDEYRNDPLVNAFYSKIIDLRRSIIIQNEEQNRWVHDIKIPLATLKLFIDNQRYSLDNEKIRTLELIALDIENDINKKIMYDKIELEIDDFKVEKLMLRPIIIDVIKKFRPSFMMKSLSIDLDLPDIQIVSDLKSVHYSVEQILNNAIKYSDSSSQIVIKMVNDTILCFENIGEPINSQDLNRLFEKGYTGKNAQSNGMASTGIGLYMTKKNLNHLNHDITILSYEKITQVLIDFKNVTKL